MGPSNEHWLSLADAFSAAAVGAEEWPAVLARLASLTGSMTGQVIGFGPSPADAFMWMADPEPGWIDSIVDAGGTDPTINPRLDAGLRAPVLSLITDAEVISREERRRHPLYADFFDRVDRPYICATTLIQDGARRTGLAVLRSHRQGEISAEQRALFAAIAPYARAAIHTQAVLEQQGALLLAGALEALPAAVFIHDGSGLVRAMTPAAEALVAAGAPLGLKGGRLHIAHHEESSRLSEAIRLAVAGVGKPGDAPLSIVPVHREALPPLLLDVIPLPWRPHALGYQPRALVVVRGAERDPSRAYKLAQAAFQLTAAEAEVALRLADGESPETVAADRGVSLNTVRAQIKATYAKLGVRRQSELAARISLLR